MQRPLISKKLSQTTTFQSTSLERDGYPAHHQANRSTRGRFQVQGLRQVMTLSSPCAQSDQSLTSILTICKWYVRYFDNKNTLAQRSFAVGTTTILREELEMKSYKMDTTLEHLTNSYFTSTAFHKILARCTCESHFPIIPFQHFRLFFKSN